MYDCEHLLCCAVQKTLMTTGIVMIIVGCIISALWLVALFYCCKIRSRRMPAQRPTGFVDGRAWDVVSHDCCAVSGR